jgi:hypothetical protein
MKLQLHCYNVSEVCVIINVCFLLAYENDICGKFQLKYIQVTLITEVAFMQIVMCNKDIKCEVCQSLCEKCAKMAIAKACITRVTCTQVGQQQ